MRQIRVIQHFGVSRLSTYLIGSGESYLGATAALTEPLFYRRWFSRERLTDRFAKQIVEPVID